MDKSYAGGGYGIAAAKERIKTSEMRKILNSIKSQSMDQLSIKEELMWPMEAYNQYKRNYVKNIQFDLDAENQCKSINSECLSFQSSGRLSMHVEMRWYLFNRY